MKDEITFEMIFKSSIIILWIATLILIIILSRYKYIPYDFGNESIVKVNRFTGNIVESDIGPGSL